nr:putative integron gene cassette protein [uncultured bacterium]
MKKTFLLTDPKIKPTRRVEAIKGDIKKYIKRERKKKLPEGFDFWDFNCSFGDTAEEKKEIHTTEIMKSIDDAASRSLDKFYLEVLATARNRSKKPKPDGAESTDKIPA